MKAIRDNLIESVVDGCASALQFEPIHGSRSAALAAFGASLRKCEAMDTATKKSGVDRCVELGLISRREADEIL